MNYAGSGSQFVNSFNYPTLTGGNNGFTFEISIPIIPAGCTAAYGVTSYAGSYTITVTGLNSAGVTSTATINFDVS